MLMLSLMIVLRKIYLIQRSNSCCVFYEINIENQVNTKRKYKREGVTDKRIRYVDMSCVQYVYLLKVTVNSGHICAHFCGKQFKAHFVFGARAGRRDGSYCLY